MSSAPVVVGLTTLAIGMIVVRDGTVPGWERRVFHWLNDMPEWLYEPLWPFQQLGALAVAPAVALVAAVLRRYWLAVAVLIAMVGKLALERVVKAIVSRQRPATSIGPDIHLRGDVVEAGESFVSGHAVLVAAMAGMITGYVPGRWKSVLWAIVVLVMLTRVYVGAHNPLDVVCGAGLGVAIAGVINLLLDPRTKDALR